ncbi:MFS transporter [Sphingobium aquiterrae]|uniref:MFS transporter n=1 Tax=Sphingobium aquiterrae TaxID=2038656 RepID=UPI00301A2AD2
MMRDADAGAHWTALQILVVVICTVINALDGMDVLIVSIIAPSLMEDWGIGLGALGMIFSAGLFGMMIGCVVVAPFADRFGRRPVVLAALTMLTVGMVGTGLVDTVSAFTAFRALAGVGIGTLLASIAALSGEFAPPGQRSIAIGWFQAGYPIGAVATGLVALWAIPAFGWQAVLVGAGGVGAILLPVAWKFLPESVAFLEARQPPRALARCNALRRRMDWPELSELPPPSTSRGVPIAQLFGPTLWRATLLLWLATLGGFAALYFMTSWITKLAIIAGLDHGDAIWATTIFNLGGFAGGLTMGWLAVRHRVGLLIRNFLVLAALFMTAFGTGMPLALLLATAGAIGVTLQGGFTGFYTLAAQLYPVEIRGSGIGWALGIGRGGAIISPLAGAYLLDGGLPLWMAFACFAVPLAISGILASLAGRNVPADLTGVVSSKPAPLPQS